MPSIPIPSSPEPRAHYLNLALHYHKFKPFHFVSFSLRNCISSRICSDGHSPCFLSFSPPHSSSSSSAGDGRLHAQFSRDEIRIDACDKSSEGDSSEHLREWLSFPDYGPKTDIGKRIFCNRPLNMKNIVAVGFDMDYTLAQYRPETFESLAYQHTVKKLVYDLNYPSELLSWSFDPNYMVRGLVLDKKRGNILKMDCHKYVKVAYHGFKELSKEDKFVTYGNTLVCDPFDGPDYALIDTLFSLAEAYLFAQLVDFKDRNPGKLPMSIEYACLYKDVRHAVDLCHRDGTLKQKVAKDPGRYINEDTSIVPMLKMLRDSGRATFLVTNSLWDYTNVVMNFLCGSSGVNGSTNLDWLQYFDVIITGSAKPSFFLDGNHANLFDVEPESGKLLNTDNGSPMPQVGNISAGLFMKEKDRKVFQGGSVNHLHNLLSIESSSQVLYVGDHIYGDILRSKKVLGWRTMLVIPELEREVQLLSELREFRKDLQFLRSKDDCIADKMHHLNRFLKLENPDDHTKQKLNSKLDELKLERETVRLSHQEALRKLHQKFHEPWGQLMKTGYQNSRFAHQVERFACLYTSRVSNLGLLSLDKYYRPSEDFMQHEFGILES
ncbi:5'-nucleotidase domain-containing protein [Trifolium repens]|nr:5'-nucleotidase domain-containing protein [Trifolium repens]